VHKEFVRAHNRGNSGMGGSRMDIEIVERTLLEDMEVVENVFRALHDEGMEISVDDFGTGYSSLSYLNRLSVDGIKIDQSFVRDLNNNTDDQSIVRAIIAMAKSLGITVTAEGVEDIFQYDFLSNVFCDEIQGYFISRPVDADRYIQFI
jgi:EAL domain-containing protein (putative c-di-GMP-specific phosphodiesterase class I)